MRPAILTLTTDFGADGPYVAQIKGVILGLAPGAQIVDVSHAVGPQDIAEGAFVLSQIVEAFPSGTVHLAVVDPGVGTERRLLVVKALDQWFVLPDNGLIGEVLRDHGSSGSWEIRNPALRRASVSSTFHGRDILAPVAAHLLLGGDPADVGPRLFDAEPTPPQVIDATRRHSSGEVAFVDPFGNLITTIRREALEGNELGEWQFEIHGHTIDGLVTTYGDRPPGSLVALIGSSGRLEVAVVNGDASRRLEVARGTPVVLRRRGIGH